VILEVLQSPPLARAGFRHAFFTRRGGHTPPPFDSLHFGGTGHDAGTLAANIGVAGQFLAIDPARLYVVTQVHGRTVRFVQGNEDRANVLGCSADVVATATPGVACGVKVADCVPILVADRKTGAVAAVHSGWQGTAVDVVGSAVAALRAWIGDGDFMAAVGPHIEVCCFEVGEDVAAKLEACAPGVNVARRGRGPRPYVDLRAIVHHQLRAVGIEDIDDVRGCTRCDADRFFSYRRDRETSGRQLAAIVARDPT
jgi:YfiH family protein